MPTIVIVHTFCASPDTRISLSAFQKLILPNHKFSLTTAFSSTDILSLLDVSFLLFAYQFLFRFTMDLLLSGSVVLIMLTL